MGEFFLPATERTVRHASNQLGGFAKLDCFFHFDQLDHWLSRMRDLIATAEGYTFPAFQESLLELRRNSMKGEFELAAALLRFEKLMENDSKKSRKQRSAEKRRKVDERPER